MKMSLDTERNYRNILNAMKIIQGGIDFKSIEGIQNGEFSRTCTMPYADDIVATFDNCVRTLEHALNENAEG